MLKRSVSLRMLAPVAFALVLLVPATAFCQLSVEVLGKIGVSSASLEDTTPAGDPVFDIGGGAQVAAMLRFVGGIAAGLNFNYAYEGHRMSQTQPPVQGPATYGVSQPSAGIVVRYDLMPSANALAWANYAFGSSTIDTENGDVEFDMQGFELGAAVRLNYQLKPYKTFIIAGAYAYYQYLSMFLVNDNANLGYPESMGGEGMGAGASLGVRFDFSL